MTMTSQYPEVDPWEFPTLPRWDMVSHPGLISTKWPRCATHRHLLLSTYPYRQQSLVMIPSWWFQPIWKIWSSNWIISPNRDENRKYLKPPPRFGLKILNEHLRDEPTDSKEKTSMTCWKGDWGGDWDFFFLHFPHHDLKGLTWASLPIKINRKILHTTSQNLPT